MSSRILSPHASPTIILAIVMTLIGCHRNERADVLSSEYNRPNLEKILDHYLYVDQDSLKYDAARFLIQHMPWHSSKDKDGNVIPDTSSISFEFLVEHIDYMVDMWRQSPYAQGISFDEFKETMLPYRASNGPWENINAPERFKWVAEHIGIPDSVNSVRKWVKHYDLSISQLRDKGGKRNSSVREGLTDLLYNDFTDCTDRTYHTCQNLRAIGIPCVVEHNLGYRTFQSNHYNCAVWIAEENRWVRFDAEISADNIGTGDWSSPQLMNLYRDCYAPQPDAIFFKPDSPLSLPRGFETPCISDATSYPVAIKVEVDSGYDHHAPYLVSFHSDGAGLQAFTFGRISGNTALFNHVVPTVWYAVAIYTDQGPTIISQPFYVNNPGNGYPVVEYCRFDGSENEIETIRLNRKYPIKEKMLTRAASLVGTVIEGANKPDFSDADILLTLTETPKLQKVNYPFDSKGDYMYYRVRTPGKFEISELEWFENDRKIKPTNRKYNKAYDGDMTTAPVDSSQISLLFKTPRLLTSVTLAPINADNAVTPGHTYELHKWERGWKLVQRQIATDSVLTFDNIPAECLLWLTDLTKGREEMPFVVTSGIQRFIYTDLVNTNGLIDRKYIANQH